MEKKAKNKKAAKEPAKAKVMEGEKKTGKKELDGKTGKAHIDLDSLFQAAKVEKKKNEEKKKKEKKREEALKKRELEAINELKMVNGDPIRYDPETGLKIYREDQLNLGKGGNTPLCPFDCDCCF